MRKLAFCFLIYDIINHEEVWHHFFSGVDPAKYTIYIHYKTNVPLRFFEQYKLRNCIPTKYGEISLVAAQNLMLQEGLKDAENTHFIFLSNSCIPLKPFSAIYAALDPQRSYFNITPQEQCFPRCNFSLRFVDCKYIQKAHQWCILNRKHATLMVTNTAYMRWFAHRYTIADEHCYITNIYYHDLTNEIVATPNLAEGATTYTNWQVDGLKNYTAITEEEMQRLIDCPSLFARKFRVECADCLKQYLIPSLQV